MIDNNYSIKINIRNNNKNFEIPNKIIKSKFSGDKSQENISENHI